MSCCDTPFFASATAVASATTSTVPSVVVTASGSSTATSSNSLVDAQIKANLIAKDVAQSNANQDANIINQTINIINSPIYSPLNTPFVIFYAANPVYLSSTTSPVSPTATDASYVTITGVINRLSFPPPPSLTTTGLGYYNFTLTEVGPDSATGGFNFTGNYNVCFNFSVGDLKYCVFATGLLNQVLKSQPAVGDNTYDQSSVLSAKIVNVIVTSTVITDANTVYTFTDIGLTDKTLPTSNGAYPFFYTQYNLNFDNAKLVSQVPL
jgi:hypothetical protein